MQTKVSDNKNKVNSMKINVLPNSEILNVEEQLKYLMSQESKLLNQTLA